MTPIILIYETLIYMLIVLCKTTQSSINTIKIKSYNVHLCVHLANQLMGLFEDLYAFYIVFLDMRQYIVICKPL